MPISNNIYFVTYQITKPDPNAAGDASAYLYRRDPVECLVLAAAQDNATLSAVITPNITLAAGEQLEIVQIESFDLGNRLVYQ